MTDTIKAVMADSDLPEALLVGFDHGDSCTIGEHDEHTTKCVKKASEQSDFSPTTDCWGCEAHEHWMILTLTHDEGWVLRVVDVDWGYHSHEEAKSVALALVVSRKE